MAHDVKRLGALWKSSGTAFFDYLCWTISQFVIVMIELRASTLELTASRLELRFCRLLLALSKRFFIW